MPHAVSDEVHKKPRWSMARTADPNWPKEYSRLLNVMLSVKNGVDDQKPLIAAQGQARHQSVGDKQWYCASLGFVFFF